MDYKMKLTLVATCILVGIGIVAIGYVIPMLAEAIIAPAHSQEAPGVPQNCDVLKVMEANLAQRFKETQIWSGKNGGGAEVRLYVSTSSSNTWTVLVVQGDHACVTSAGTDSAIGSDNLPGMPA